MTTTPQDPTPPLWRVMYQAYDNSSHPQWEEHHGMAAEIRAVADWLVPEELENLKPQDPEVRIKWRTGLELRQRLLAEADRAERGDA